MNLMNTPCHHKMLLPVFLIKTGNDDAPGGCRVNKIDLVPVEFYDYSYMANDIFLSSGLKKQQVTGSSARKWQFFTHLGHSIGRAGQGDITE